MWNNSCAEDPEINENLALVQQRAPQMIDEFRDVFDSKPGQTTLLEHHIETGTARPIQKQPYRLPYAHQETVEKKLEEMKEAGMITPLNSQLASNPETIKDI